MKPSPALIRLLQSLLMLVLLSLGVFLLLHAIPGGPFDHILQASSGGATAEDLRRVEGLLGLQRPWFERYGHWLGQWLSGDWGRSWSVAMQEPVRGLVLPRLGRSAVLALLASGIAFGASAGLGAWAALRPGRGRWLNGLLSSLHSVPTFCLALLALMLVLALGLRPDGAGAGNSFLHILLPALVLALSRLNEWTRLFRNEFEEVLAQPYILGARARGLSERRVLFAHALPNVLAALGNIVALDLPALVSGTLVVEAALNYPGMGLLAYHAVQANDWPLVQSMALLTGILVAFSNAGADLLRWAMDPRLRERA